MRKLQSQCLATLLIFLQGLPARAALTPFQPERAKVGILRVGELESGEQEKAYLVLEKRVQRWFENFSAPRPLVQALGHSSTSDAEFLRFKGAVEKSERSGPQLQKANLAEAYVLFTQGKKAAAATVLRRAIALHPDGKAPELEVWDEAPSASSLRFENLVTEVAAQVRGLCDVQLSGLPPTAVVSVNGFAQGMRREFHLPTGHFEFHFSSPGFESSPLPVHCERTSKFRPIVRLSPSSGRPALASSELEQVRQRHALGALFVIQPVRDEFRFFLASSDGKLDAVPTQRPLKISEVTSGDEGLPISQDAMRELLQRHALAVSMSDLTGVASDGHRDFGGGVSEGRVGATSQWYNDWRVWAVVGGLATGILGAYLLTRGPEVHTQPGISIRLE